MSSFSEELFVRKLGELNNSPQSIQTLSLWAIHYRKNAGKIVSVWLRELKKQKQPRRLVNLLYLCNDIAQNSRKKGPEYTKEFSAALDKAFVHVSHYADEKSLQAMKRVIDVWRDRVVFDSATIDRLLYAITQNLTRDKLALFHGKKVTSGKPPLVAALKSKPIDQTKEKVVVLPKPEFSPVLAQTPPLETKPVDFPSRLSPAADEAPDTEELLNFVKKMEKSASADAETRRKIADLPEEVSKLDRLESIETKFEAENFSTVVDSAHELLSTYNERLESEVRERLEMLRKLRAYSKCQKEKLAADEKVLAQWKGKLHKLEIERDELKKHVESLPDLSSFEESKLTPLPSAGELFTK